MSRRLAAALLSLALPTAAAAFEQLTCLDDSGPAHYRDELVPTLAFSPFGATQDAAVRRAFLRWNTVPGARAELTEGPAASGCDAPPAGGRFTWSDPVACYTLVGFAAGVTIHAYDEVDPCLITSVDVVIDSEVVAQAGETIVESVTLHELGHALLLGHEWDELSIMGYPEDPGANPTELFADDHEARVTLAPEGAAPPARIRLSAFRPSTSIEPDRHSFTRIFGPTCAPGACLVADARTELSLDVTVENVGAQARTSPLRVVLRLIPSEGGEATEVAAYAFPRLEAHSSWSGSIGGTPPAELPDGTYLVEVTLEADGVEEGQLAPEERRLAFRNAFQRGDGANDQIADYLADDEPAPAGCGCGGGGGASLAGLFAAVMALRPSGRRRRS